MSRALEERGAGAVLRCLRTERQLPFPDLGSAIEAPLWLVRAERGVWLVAATERRKGGAVSSLAVGGTVRIEDGFPSGAVVVEHVRARLARGDVEEARQLIEGRTRGPTYSFDPRLAERWPPLPSRGPVTLPDGFPTGPDAPPWLYALETASTVRWPGRLRDLDRPIWLGFTEDAVFAVVPGEGAAGVRPLDGAVTRARSFPVDVLRVGDAELSMGLFGRHGLELAVALGAEGPDARWARVGLELWNTGRPERALALAEAAVARGRAAALSPLFTRLFVAAGRGAEAATTLAGAQDDHELATFDRFESATRAGGDPLSDERTETLARAAGVTPLSPPEGAPWPPEHPAEIWGAARGQLPDAYLSEARGHVRGLRFIAALDPAPEAWAAAARAARAAGDREGARIDLARALSTHPRPTLAWLAVAWAFEDASEKEAALRTALELDPMAEAAPGALGATTLETAALAAERWGLDGASALLEAADAAQGAEVAPETRWARAERLRSAGDLGRAARVFARLAGDPEKEVEDRNRPRWRARIESAKAFAGAAEPDRAREQIERAVAEDFLHADALRSAAAVEGVVSDDRRQWWQHVASVLEGAESPSAAPGLKRLSAAALEQLHPGDQDWWDEVRTQINLPKLPARDALIRGLSRLEGTEFPEVFDLVAALSHGLGLEPVPTYVYRGDDAVGLSGWPTQPPVLLIGVEHLREGPRKLSLASLRFALAVELAHLAAGHPVLAFDDSLLGTSRSVYQAFGRFAGTAETAVDLVSLIPGVDQLAKLQLLFRLSRRVFFVRNAFNKATGLVQPVLKRFFPTSKERSRGLSRRGLSGAALAFRVQADRAALRLGGDLGAAVRALLATGEVPALRLERWAQGGLSALLERSGEDEDDVTLGADEAFRLAALVEEAVTHGPFGPDTHDGQPNEKSS